MISRVCSARSHRIQRCGALSTLSIRRRWSEAGGEPTALFATLCAKEAVAELAEATLGRLARVIGGGTFSRRNPFAHWYEDVRAPGFLRPPWGLAHDNIFELSFS